MNHKEGLSDEQWVRRALENPDDFYFLMKRYEGKLLRYIKRISDVTHEEAEDLLQDVFFKAYRNLNSFDQTLKFSSWIYRIAHNSVLNYVRKRKIRSILDRLGDDGETGNLKQEDIPGDMGADSRYQSYETHENMENALAELPVRYREVLILHYFEEKSYDEISEILRKPSGTVATWIKRAKKRLKKIAPRYGLVETGGI